MGNISSCELPHDALLREYVTGSNFTDCYVARIRKRIVLHEFVSAFYSSPLFTLERLILKWVFSKPSNRSDIEELANGTATTFAAWSVEARRPDELLLKDYLGRTRSWLKCEPVAADDKPQTAVFFGSAVVFSNGIKSSERRSDALFRALLPFHKLYSRALLWSAKRKLGE